MAAQLPEKRPDGAFFFSQPRHRERPMDLAKRAVLLNMGQHLPGRRLNGPFQAFKMTTKARSIVSTFSQKTATKTLLQFSHLHINSRGK